MLAYAGVLHLPRWGRLYLAVLLTPSTPNRQNRNQVRWNTCAGIHRSTPPSEVGQTLFLIVSLLLPLRTGRIEIKCAGTPALAYARVLHLPRWGRLYLAVLFTPSTPHRQNRNQVRWNTCAGIRGSTPPSEVGQTLFSCSLYSFHSKQAE